jgi:hypothetical protein
MNESEYYAGEFTDANLDALADAGEFPRFSGEGGSFAPSVSSWALAGAETRLAKPRVEN